MFLTYFLISYAITILCHTKNGKVKFGNVELVFDINGIFYFVMLGSDLSKNGQITYGTKAEACMLEFIDKFRG